MPTRTVVRLAAIPVALTAAGLLGVAARKVQVSA